jgi:hypothetical protein
MINKKTKNSQRLYKKMDLVSERKNKLQIGKQCLSA